MVELRNNVEGFVLEHLANQRTIGRVCDGDGCLKYLSPAIDADVNEDGIITAYHIDQSFLCADCEELDTDSPNYSRKKAVAHWAERYEEWARNNLPHLGE